VFIDELNTCSYGGCLKEIIADKTFHGEVSIAHIMSGKTLSVICRRNLHFTTVHVRGNGNQATQ
jgi:hypothetical protein